jgi:circadian clock protein KaiC
MAQITTTFQLPKSKTGIQGLDDITGGGFPTGRPTLLCGSAGCGKTLMAMEFLIRGILDFDEPGVFMAFEETKEELTYNVASLGFDLNQLVEDNKLRLDHVHIDRSEIEETGEYDLEGLFIRLGYAIDSIGAKRVVLDTIESLFSGLSNQAILRSEIRRLFRWLKERGVTAVITGERGEGSLTRQGLEEYVSDCVILLDHRVIDQVSTRRLRIVKYRGTVHGTNEYPFLIDEDGISVLPDTSLELKYRSSKEIISSGIPALNEMLGSGGYFRGSSVLVSGFAGTGKTSIASFFANQVCGQKQRCLYFAFEESQDQISRNMESIGLNLSPYVADGLLKFQANSPTIYGLEMHLVAMHKAIKSFKPEVVIVDPITNLRTVASCKEVKAMLTRLIYFLKSEGITALFVSEIKNSDQLDPEDEGISSLIDTWLMVRDLEANGERNRGIYVLKSRGMHNSNKVREFIINDQGLQLLDVATDTAGNVLVGSARQSNPNGQKGVGAKTINQ